MARRKITSVDDLPAAELPVLTDQQMDWVRHRLAGKSATDAYRQSYDCADMLDRTVWAEASRMNTNPSITAWMDAARKACLGSAKITLDQHVERLDRLATIAIQTGNVGAAVAAEQTIGKVLGHHVERFQDVGFDPVSALEELARLSPAAAKALAEETGVALPTETTH